MASEVPSNTRIEILAPAKLNLFLRITGRGDDGYHALQTVFQFIDLCDEVTLETRTDGRIERSGTDLGIAPQDDLAVRAARAVQLVTGISHGVNIKINKRIPTGAGLGGGSSNAASVLLGLNELWQLGFKPTDLARIGLELGADVPIFVHGKATWAEGVGERFMPIALEERDFLLATPSIHVSTVEVFGSPQLTRDCDALTIAGFPMTESLRSARHLMLAGNVCEAVVRNRYAEIAHCMAWLEQWGVTRMTGTGSACFAVPERDALEAALAAATDAPCPVNRVRGLSESPALRALPSRTT